MHFFHKLLNKPIKLILIFNFIIFIIGITWGLPNSESWLSDSLAPFHPLVGLSKGFSFGYFNKYPLIHQLLLAILNIPVVITALINSNPIEGFQIFHIIALIKSPAYATVLILIDRSVSIIMGVLIIYLIYLCSKELFDEKTALFSALLASFNPVLNFYSHVAKVEVPYIFWAFVAIYFLIRIVKYENIKDYIYCAITTCLSFGTKDQAYAIFILPFIFYLSFYRIIYRDKSLSILNIIFNKKTVLFILIFSIATLIAQNIILNYDGFLLRFNHLTGEGGQRSIAYASGFLGSFALFIDTFKTMMVTSMGIPIFIITILGLVIFVKENFKFKNIFFIQSIFIIASISYYIFFIQIIKQNNARFSLTIALFLVIYAGYGVNYLLQKHKENNYKIFILTFILILPYSFYNTISLNANMIFDTRYKVEKWMENNIPIGSTIEYYSYLHYLPRFPATSKPYRIKKKVIGLKNRNPDYIVLTSHYYPRFIGDTTINVKAGRLSNTQKILKFKKSNFQFFLKRLFNNKLNYKLVKRQDENIPFFKKFRFSRISPNHILVYKKINNHNIK